MARYRKIDTRILNDQKFNHLSDDGKLIFFILLAHPHLTPLGAMRASLPGLASELRWSLKKFEKGFNEILVNKMLKYDELAGFIWLPNFLKYNQPESPNVVRSWEHYLDYLPECELKNELIDSIKRFVETLSSPFQEALPEVFLKTMPNQEQEHKQEQKQEQEKISMSGKPDVDPLKSFSFEKQNQTSLKEQAIEVLNFLNEKTGKAYRLSDINLKFIMARLKTGATVMDCRQIIAKKNREWRGDPKMSEYLRPATLFNPSKFEQYIGELVVPKEDEVA